jgi:hypothetical protein
MGDTSWIDLTSANLLEMISKLPRGFACGAIIIIIIIFTLPAQAGLWAA